MIEIKARPAILVTGFGRYPGVRKNPTAQIMQRVVARVNRHAGRGVAHGRELTVSYARARLELAQSVQDRQPEAILLLGLAARARWVRIERYARRLDSPLHPDSAGLGGGPHASASDMPLRATGLVEPALHAMLARGVRARLSPSAGRYLCNAVFAAALLQSGDRPVLFVHLPYPRGAAGKKPRALQRTRQPSVAQLEHALNAVAMGLILQARRARLAQTPLA